MVGVGVLCGVLANEVGLRRGPILIAPCAIRVVKFLNRSRPGQVHSLFAPISLVFRQLDGRTPLYALAVERDRAARAEAEAKAQLAEANARVAELAGKLASLAERQQAIAATPWWRRGRMAMKLLGPGGE